eukprot:6944045-Prorocentrum_lima.AAC.1
MCIRDRVKDAGTRELMNRLRQQTDMAQQQRRMIGGRELLFYIVRFYSVREECGHTYLFKDLMQVTLGKDDNGAKLE